MIEKTQPGAQVIQGHELLVIDENPNTAVREMREKVEKEKNA
jgi:hypothetical protein